MQKDIMKKESLSNFSITHSEMIRINNCTMSTRVHTPLKIWYCMVHSAFLLNDIMWIYFNVHKCSYVLVLLISMLFIDWYLGHFHIFMITNIFVHLSDHFPVINS